MNDTMSFSHRLRQAAEDSCLGREPSREDRVAVILAAYGDPKEFEASDITDLLADTMHYVKAMRQAGHLDKHFDALVEDARGHFNEEALEGAEPCIWLNDDEDTGTLECGCVLERDRLGGGPAFTFCETHDPDTIAANNAGNQRGGK